ncbi:MAG: hypothetical protein V1494_03445 [Candidatus Diapherotrites archaeon]
MRQVGRPMTATQWRKLTKLTSQYRARMPSREKYLKLSFEEKMERQKKKEKMPEKARREYYRVTGFVIQDSEWLWTFNFKLMFGKGQHGIEKLNKSGYSFERLRKAQPKLVGEIEKALARHGEEEAKGIKNSGYEKFMNEKFFELERGLEKEIGGKLHKLYIFLRRRGVTNKYLL